MGLFQIDCFGTYFTHVQTCDDVRAHSATLSTASVHVLDTCPNLWWCSCSQCYAIECFGTCTWHMSKPVMMFVFTVLRYRLLRYMYLTHVQTCDDVRVHSATLSTASVHVLDTCPNLWWCSCSQCYAIDCFGTSTKALHEPNSLVFMFLPNYVLISVMEKKQCPKPIKNLTCYAMPTSLSFAHMVDATRCWCLLHLHTWSVLRDVDVVLKIWKI